MSTSIMVSDLIIQQSVGRFIHTHHPSVANTFHKDLITLANIFSVSSSRDGTVFGSYKHPNRAVMRRHPSIGGLDRQQDSM